MKKKITKEDVIRIWLHYYLELAQKYFAEKGLEDSKE